jgi:hypothetical protein
MHNPAARSPAVAIPVKVSLVRNYGVLPSRTPAAQVSSLGIYVHGNTRDASRQDLTKLLAMTNVVPWPHEPMPLSLS